MHRIRYTVTQLLAVSLIGQAPPPPLSYLSDILQTEHLKHILWKIRPPASILSAAYTDFPHVSHFSDLGGWRRNRKVEH